MAPGVGPVYTHPPSCDPPWSVLVLREPSSSSQGAVLASRKMPPPPSKTFIGIHTAFHHANYGREVSYFNKLLGCSARSVNETKAKRHK